MAEAPNAGASKEVRRNADLFAVKKKRPEQFITDELVIALCGPIGSPIHKVAEAIQKALQKEFGYTTSAPIRLSDFIREHGNPQATDIAAIDTLPNSAKFKEKKKLIEQGNQLRAAYSNSVLADLAIHKIAASREGGAETATRRIYHIIDSVKNKEELEALRSVYGEMLYFVGVFSPLAIRERALEDAGMSSAEVHMLIDQDSGEEIDNGQTVRDTFPQADFFLRIETDTDSQILGKVERFLHLILGTKVLTPTLAETAMYQASSAAGNSACLSRQVGAAVTDRKGQIISIGWNDVPRSGGGLYAYNPADPTGEHDRRCWNISGGTCFNDAEKDLLTHLVVEELINSGLANPDKKDQITKMIRSNKKLSGLIEFSRSIHAEMHAILNAGLSDGGRIKEGKLFVTTYPCHACARHIIASGISEIYYIEPYRKSLAVKLHRDSITEQDSDGTSKVKILMYEGVSPTRYPGLFRVPQDSRKENGKMRPVNPMKAKPRFARTLEAVPVLESLKVKELQDQGLISKGERQ